MEETIFKSICDSYRNGDFDKVIDADAVYEYKDTILKNYVEDVKKYGENIAIDNAIYNALVHGECKGFENGLKIGMRLMIH